MILLQVHRDTDITMGDFWGIQNVLPQFYSDKGVSLLLIHSQKGKELWDKIKCNLDFVKSTEKDCLQPNLISSTKRPIRRNKFWEKYRKYGINFIMKKYGKDSISTRLRWKLVNFFHILK